MLILAHPRKVPYDDQRSGIELFRTGQYTRMSSKYMIRLGRRSPCYCDRKCFSTSVRRRAGEVRVVEVGPRDGLQNENTSIPLETKLELIRRLSQTGVRNIEAGSFVAPKWVPQVKRHEGLYGLSTSSTAVLSLLLLTDGKFSRSTKSHS